MNKPNKLMTLAAGAGAAALLAGSAFAGDAKCVIDDKNPVPAPEPWSICDLFDYSTLYKSDTGFFNKIALIGRYQGQWHNTDANQGDDAGWENRRFRAGLKLEFLDQFEFEGQFNLNVDEGDFVEDVEDLTVSWEPNDDLYVTVGKQKAKVTREWSTTSRKIKTMERSQMVNQVVPDKLGGVVVGYHLTDALWAEVGGYTLDVTDDWALPEFNAGYGVSGRIGYDISEATEVRFDYLHMEQDPNNDTPPYDNVFSLNSESHWDAFGLVTDLIFATGTDSARHDDAFSAVFMPTYKLTDKLEAVFRYTYSTSDSATGIRLQKRYERAAADLNQYGSDYNAFYFGLNYYICEDKLKLMTGAEYSSLGAPAVGSSHDKVSGDFDGWTYWAGVRLYF